MKTTHEIIKEIRELRNQYDYYLEFPRLKAKSILDEAKKIIESDETAYIWLEYPVMMLKHMINGTLEAWLGE